MQGFVASGTGRTAKARPAVALFTWAAVMLGVGTAQAGGPPEILNRVTVDPGDPTRMVMAYEYAGSGVVFTNDGGQTWEALCADAVSTADASAARMGPIGLGGDGTLFIGLFSDALRDNGAGCGFQTDPHFDMEWVSDFSTDPAEPGTLYAATSTTTQGEDNSVHRRTGDGEWEVLGVGTDALVSRVRVTSLPGGGKRIYQSASRLDATAGTTTFFIRVSDDEGATWTEHPQDLGELTNADRFELEAIDPTNPDRIVAVHRKDLQQRMGATDEVLVSEDQGATFKSLATLTAFGGLDMASDGRIWIGDRGDSFAPERPFGLWHAASLNDAVAPVDDTHNVSCVRYLPDQDRVFLCDLTTAGTIAAEGSGYTQVYTFAAVSTVVDCGGQDMVAACQEQYTRFWCTAAHFPSAPLCCPYVDGSGLLAGTQQPDGVDCSGPTTAWAGRADDAPREPGPIPNPGSDAGPAPSDEPMSSPSSPMVDDAAMAGAGGGTATATSMVDDGGSGCGCSVPGRTRDVGAPASLAVAAFGLWAARRRRRRCNTA